MALTNAERQARFRKNQRSNGGRQRFSFHLSHAALLAMRRLAAYHGITQEAAIQMALKQADDAMVLSLTDRGEVADYLDRLLRHDGTVVK